MATLQEQLDKAKNDVKRFEGLLASANDYAKANNLKTKTDAQKQYAKALADAKAKVTQLTNKKTEAAKTPEQKKVDTETAARGSLPMSVDDKLWNEIKNIVPNISTEAFASGGVGAGILVYQGMENVQVQGRGQKITQQRPKVAIVNDVINSFWTDKAIQNKVLSALIAAGKSNATQLDAYATWQSIVQQSAQLYNAGKGPKFTPMDILNMSITKAGGTKPDVTTYINMPKDIELKQTLKNGIYPYLKKIVPDNDPIFQTLFNEVKQMYSKGVTSTTTVDPKTGKKIVTQTPGVSTAEIDARIQKAYRNTPDYLEAKSIEGFDKFSQWQREGNV